jgi:hypothetical protein
LSPGKDRLASPEYLIHHDRNQAFLLFLEDPGIGNGGDLMISPMDLFPVKGNIIFFD